ncbi:dTDP-4-dehydrorhamnose 3,5-epimerase [Pseudomonas protegens]|uniref:dTDP-4-dehydrorhamnose 3,5-epimerase n=1 Tax=Pseudomonas protegens TaxID=380021 RepID=UPI000F47B032|nr:dTDP-4-dehydrorhamnose 3,5-epimerase [Pseudomonas protegens]ROL96859.1 dTDP-4-dehydrorhamnose 3,5-epimerase [Pseudomonas protegens]ROM08909.1 dTDP-4-dehydrorhamnose 3,5-epimerase [Pseudomonas protegens]ROM12686.1 dTDP-4-dehydrorhamnose 3,5-epimerase [Pseudomonas protegens]
MKLTQTRVPDVVVIEPNVFDDDRGWFMETFNEPAFHARLRALGLALPRPLIQDNHSSSKKGVLRGLHFQLAPHAQGKLVRVVKGAAWDVAVDIRKGSPTYGMWVGEELTAENRKMMWIPEGFAHGFIALEDDTHFLYKTTDVYSKESEGSLAWDDPDLAIHWPRIGEPNVSEKDRKAPAFKDFEGVDVPAAKSDVVLQQFRVIGDERGSLISLECADNVPFIIKRVYYIFSTQADVSRGFHAHRDLQQLAICVSGKCRMTLDDGHSRQDVWLDKPNKGVLIRNLIWREMHDFSEDCVLMVLASGHYDESDYIRNYEDFVKEVANGKK